MRQDQRLWVASIALIGVLIVALLALAGVLQRNGGAPQGASPSETPGRGLAVVVSPSATQTRRPEASPGLIVEPTVEQGPTQTPGTGETATDVETPSGGIPLYPSRRATAPDTATPMTGTTGGDTRAATATIRATSRPLATATDAEDASETAAPTSPPSPTTSLTIPTSSPTATAPTGATPTSGAQATPAPQQTLPVNPTATPGPPGISGRVLLNGQAAEPGLVLLLEDASFTIVAETTVGEGGAYRFENAPAADEGYNVTFNWERNQTYDLSEVIAWGWIGAVSYDGESAVQLPDLEIGLSGLAQIEPEPDTNHAAPLTFGWGAHPAATRYWVDLLADGSFARVWHSAFTESTSTTFNGRLDDGSRVQPGRYWWAVGGQRTVDGYQITVYGHLAGLTIGP